LGRLTLLIYLDTAPLIYLVEHVPQFGDRVAQRLSSTDELIVSDLSRLECRVKPMRDGDGFLLEEFDRFFNESVSEVIALSREVIDRATEIRSRYGFKTPDAIHLAAATVSNCELFLTNDSRLDRFAGLRIDALSV
jgi:uncharacterized protein